MTTIAQSVLIILLPLFLLLHLLILLQIIPYQMVWGGRLKSSKEMYRFEIVSIIVNALLLALVLAKAGMIVTGLPAKIIGYAFWLMALLFLVNTLGNALSKNKLEKWLFTPLTVVMAVCSLVLALSS